MAADQLWVSIEIKRGSTVLVSPTIYQATNQETFGSLLGQVGSGTSDQHLEQLLQVETVEKVTISGAASVVHVVPLSAPVQMVGPTYIYLLYSVDVCSIAICW